MFINNYTRKRTNISFTKAHISLDDLQDDEKDETVKEEIKTGIKMLGYKKLATHYLADEVHKQMKDAKLTAAAYHQDTHILVVGFNNGSFYLYEMPHANLIHSLRYLLRC